MELVWLRKTIEERGVPQKEIADVIGVSESAMSKILSGQRQLKSVEADKIRRHLGYILPEDLAPGTPERQIIDRLAVLDERGKRALALYLEALVSQPV